MPVNKCVQRPGIWSLTTLTWMSYFVPGLSPPRKCSICPSLLVIPGLPENVQLEVTVSSYTDGMCRSPYDRKSASSV